MLQVEAQSKGNTLDIARGVRAEVERIKPGLPAGTDAQRERRQRGADRGGAAARC